MEYASRRPGVRHGRSVLGFATTARSRGDEPEDRGACDHHLDRPPTGGQPVVVLVGEDRDDPRREQHQPGAEETTASTQPTAGHQRTDRGGQYADHGQHHRPWISPGDHSEAGRLTTLAAAEARRLDQPGSLARAQMLLTDLDVRRRADDPLTVREREVAGLVAKALSNRQIAERLVLSERTIESHVRNILTKLGLSNRTELTAHLLGDQH
jgi:DNA-binding CsgD family transcriptional regulator